DATDTKPSSGLASGIPPLADALIALFDQNRDLAAELARAQKDANDRFALLERAEVAMRQLQNDADGRLALLQNAKTRMQQFENDADNRLALLQNAKTRMQQLENDADNRLALLQDAKTRMQQLQQDADNRLRDVGILTDEINRLNVLLRQVRDEFLVY